MSSLPPSPCPECGYMLDGATDPFDEARKPAAGDVSICIKCLSFLRFDAGLRLVALCTAEFLALSPDVRDLMHRMRRVAGPLDRTNLH